MSLDDMHMNGFVFVGFIKVYHFVVGLLDFLGGQNQSS
jgi:hypothetical protein